MTENFFEFYLWGLLVCINLIITFYSSSIKIKFFEILFFILKKEHQVITLEDFDDYVFKNWGAFGEMLTCCLCFGFWLSILISTAIQQYFNLPFYYIIFSAFSWPSLSSIALRIYMRK
tara:strand:+ start:16369 stop:16722 length:354 start_codon:yes stop_codon:yes gene_type:complete